jgi:hypothetical protein
MLRRVTSFFFLFTLIAFFFTSTMSSAQALTITNPNLQYFGYYNLDGLPVGSANYIPEVKNNLGNSNVAHVGADLDQTKMRSYLQSARDSKMKVIINVFWVFFANSGSATGTTKAKLDPNYQSRWNTFVAILAPYKDDLYGFYFDEPYWQGIQPEDFKTVTGIIKQSFPNKAIMAVEAYPVIENNATTLTNTNYLRDVTDYGFDYYFNTKTAYGSREPFTTYQTLYQKMKQLAGNRKIWVVPGTIGEGSSDGTQLAANFNDYLQLANSDQQVVGILNFLYPRFGAEFPLAAQDYLKSSSAAYSSVLTDAHQQAGKAIIGNVTLPPCTGDFDNNRTIDLLDYAIFLQNFLRSPLSNSKTDMNGDGIVDLIDYSIFTQNFLHSCGT